MIVRSIERNTDCPPDHLISAVFLIALRGDRVLAVRNERGWDIPGGHVEAGETPMPALIREVIEEAAVTFRQAQPCSFMTVPHRRELMLFFVTDEFEFCPFSPHADAFERAMLPVQELLERYHGPKEILSELVRIAASAVRRSTQGSE